MLAVNDTMLRIEIIQEKIKKQKERLSQFKDRALSVNAMHIDDIIDMNEELIALEEGAEQPEIQSVIRGLNQDVEHIYADILSEQINYYKENIALEKKKHYEDEVVKKGCDCFPPLKQMKQGLMEVSQEVFHSEVLKELRPCVLNLQVEVNRLYSNLVTAYVHYQKQEIIQHQNRLDNYKKGKAQAHELDGKHIQQAIKALKNLSKEVLAFKCLNPFYDEIMQLRYDAVDLHDRINHICVFKQINEEISKIRMALSQHEADRVVIEEKLIILREQVQTSAYLTRKNKGIFTIIIHNLYSRAQSNDNIIHQQHGCCVLS